MSASASTPPASAMTGHGVALEHDPCPGRTRADDGRRTTIVRSDGRVLEVAVDRWFRDPSPAEHELLELALAPVLDIGCGPARHVLALAGPARHVLALAGPARHVLALASAGVSVLGIDISKAFLAVARRDGASVIHCSVFDNVPRAGSWGTALLLDGNIGIGADPRALLRRTREILAPGGRLLLEAAPPGSSSRCDDVHVQLDAKRGPLFKWESVPIDRVQGIATEIEMPIVRCWSAEGRWFAWLDREQSRYGTASLSQSA